MDAQTAHEDTQLPCSMLLSFRAENVRSFEGKVELSMLGTRVSEKEVIREIPWREGGKAIPVLPVAGVFGANASGKSNLLKAMDEMRGFVLHSFRYGTPQGKLPTHPFLLNDATADSPSTFEVDLVLNGVRHEYGFRVDRNRVIEEWAHHYPRGRSVLMFRRFEDQVHLGTHHRAKGRATQEILRNNALFLSTAGATEHPGLLPLFQWFQRNLLFADVNSRSLRQVLTTEMLEDPDIREPALALLREADLGITGAKKREIDPEIRQKMVKVMAILRGEEAESASGDDEIEFDDVEVSLLHKGHGSVELELTQEEESRGTLVWFGLIGPVIDVLMNGSVLLADELDASLHPALVEVLVSIFQSPESNPNRAQLIFNSHDVSLLGNSGNNLLGRDQIWFTEKADSGESQLYPLTDLDPRKDESTVRRYLAGRYGAVPIVSTSQIRDLTHELATSGTK